ncbi:MAG: hypothetical protein U1F43_14145 [Myxococcota bacterium]
MSATEPREPIGPSGIDRTGHLSEMAFDRLKLDRPEADPAFHAAAQAHLADCAGCRAAFDALRAEDDVALPTLAALQVGARPRLRLVDRDEAGGEAGDDARDERDDSRAAAADARPRRRQALGRIALGAGAALAMAAGLLLFTRPAQRALPVGGVGVDPTEELVARGGNLDFEVHVHDGTKSRLVDDGGVVHPGERAGFGLRASADGFVLVFGWDQTGTAYAAYPLGGDLATLRAAPIQASREPVAVPSAIRFDDLLGDEHLAAVYCDHAFALSDVLPAGAVDLHELQRRLGVTTAEGPVVVSAGTSGCVMRHLVLHKRAR